MPKRISATQVRGEGARLPRIKPSLDYQNPAKYAGVATKPSNTLSVPEMERMIAQLCIDVYLSGGERITPMQPFVLVRVLPKDMVSAGGIVLPDQRQNKPMHEGIVLEVYRPYKEYVTIKETGFDSHGREYSEDYVKEVWYECPVKVGQRVGYPHYEGVPHKYLGDNYVMVRQSADQNKFPYCQILGVIDYDGDRKIGNKITKLMRQYYSVTESGASVSLGGDPITSAK